MPKIVRTKSDQIEKIAIYEGDTITLGIQSAAIIDGQNAWIKAEYSSSIQEGEDQHSALERISTNAQQLFRQHTMASVETITSMGD